ncbi:MAG: hypothetical protein IJ166_11700 [Prevotella sp.]|nr:hypothetical protein [Prevotella sp.]
MKNEWMIDGLFWLLYIMLALTVVLTLVSVVRAWINRDKTADVQNRIPVARIRYVAIAVLVVCLLLTYVFGSSSPLNINGVQFTDTFWLKLSDMFLNTAFFLIVVAAIILLVNSGYRWLMLLKKGKPSTKG